MAPGKRRRTKNAGKQGGGKQSRSSAAVFQSQSTPGTSVSSWASTARAPLVTTTEGGGGGGGDESLSNWTAAANATTTTTTSPTACAAAVTSSSSSLLSRIIKLVEDENDLILPSAKKRGVYECDYCHGDVSQLPRIRCAVCDDFDLCLDCFVSSSSSSSTSSSINNNNNNNNNPQPPPLRSSRAATASANLENNERRGQLHNPALHGYRVCDSTRFPIFPTARQWTGKAFAERIQQESTTLVGPAKTNNQYNNDIAKMEDFHKRAADDSEITAVDALPKEVDEPVKDKSDTETEDDENDDDEIKGTSNSQRNSTQTNSNSASYIFRADDPKMYWTLEEDLRLLEGIRNHGLGNWVEIAETVAGQGSVGKTPKRCMERYLDDYLGRYGRILPPYTLVPYDEDEDTGYGLVNAQNFERDLSSAAFAESIAATPATTRESSRCTTPAPSKDGSVDYTTQEDLPSRSSKRRAALLRNSTGNTTGGPPNLQSSTMASRKRYKIVPTDSLEGYSDLWPDPYYPSKRIHVLDGEEVGRDHICRAEQTYVKLIGAAQSEAEVEAIRKEWATTKLGKRHGPTVLPPRPEDVMAMSGADLAGFMPRRGDFDIEWENESEEAIADMEFLPGDSEEDKQLKLKVLAIYNSKLDKREEVKKFIISRKLWDYRKLHQDSERWPRDERDLVHRMRLFERFHTPGEHQLFLDDIIQAKRLRKEIAKLQMYRRMGIRTLVEAEKFELDKARILFHKRAAAAASVDSGEGSEQQQPTKDSEGSSSDRKSKTGKGDDDAASSLWRQYRPKIRKTTSILLGDSNQKDQPVSDSTVSKIDPPEERSSGRMEHSTTSTLGRSNDRSLLSSLSSSEADLCQKLGLSAAQYREIKKVLIHESLLEGLLDKEGPGSGRRTLLQMDVQRRGNLLDFFLKAGWVSPRLCHVARSLPSTTMLTSSPSSLTVPGATTKPTTTTPPFPTSFATPRKD